MSNNDILASLSKENEDKNQQNIPFFQPKKPLDFTQFFHEESEEELVVIRSAN